ncbi:hypothetical protein M427DRAFT_55728 [Gonapodya prolifera JEL478]|uniref:Nonsense-mediated mRNA decay factor SMG8 n=1 Tax=Gonapodya prolifera (strain JEL478) TaxID=1344416 RepID=A0A139AHX8_GONPJ|nr:hypothetical protein M427DRAFT_55728 [Gonapodya prolifera JEL478]|eukprot:KXS16299.1 hypothetical protein M427DRAFT_55728 [Gonapodya prolifera JEL478]
MDFQEFVPADWKYEPPARDELEDRVQELCTCFQVHIDSTSWASGNAGMVAVIGDFECGKIGPRGNIVYGDVAHVVDRIAGWSTSLSTSSTVECKLSHNVQLRLIFDRRNNTMYLFADAEAAGGDFQTWHTEANQLWTTIQLTLLSLCSVVVFATRQAALGACHTSILKLALSLKLDLANLSTSVLQFSDVIVRRWSPSFGDGGQTPSARRSGPKQPEQRSIPVIFSVIDSSIAASDPGRLLYLRPALRELGVLGIDPNDSRRAIVCLPESVAAEYHLNFADIETTTQESLSLLDYIRDYPSRNAVGNTNASYTAQNTPVENTPQQQQDRPQLGTRSSRATDAPTIAHLRRVLNLVAQNGTGTLFRNLSRGDMKGTSYGIARGVFAPLRGGMNSTSPKGSASEEKLPNLVVDLPSKLQAIVLFLLIPLAVETSYHLVPSLLQCSEELAVSLQKEGSLIFERVKKDAANSELDWAEAHCREARDKAAQLYSGDGHEVLYGTKEHLSRLSSSLRLYRRLARGRVSREKYEAELIEMCVDTWNGKYLPSKRKCEERSLLQHECGKRFGHQGNHLTEEKLRQSCDCGRYIKARGEAFDAKTGNYLALSCCPPLGDEDRILPLEKSGDEFAEANPKREDACDSAEAIIPPADWTWSLVRVSSHNHFDRQDGMIKSGCGWGVLSLRTRAEAKGPNNTSPNRNTMESGKEVEGKDRGKRRRDKDPQVDGANAPKPATLASFIDIKSLTDDRPRTKAIASDTARSIPTIPSGDAEGSQVPRDRIMLAMEYECPLGHRYHPHPATLRPLRPPNMTSASVSGQRFIDRDWPIFTVCWICHPDIVTNSSAAASGSTVRVLGRAKERKATRVTMAAQLMRIKISVGAMDAEAAAKRTIRLAPTVRVFSNTSSQDVNTQLETGQVSPPIPIDFSPNGQPITLSPGSSTVLRLPYIYTLPANGETVPWSSEALTLVGLEGFGHLQSGWLALV